MDRQNLRGEQLEVRHNVQNDVRPRSAESGRGVSGSWLPSASEQGLG